MHNNVVTISLLLLMDTKYKIYYIPIILYYVNTFIILIYRPKFIPRIYNNSYMHLKFNFINKFIKVKTGYYFMFLYFKFYVDW